MNLLEISVEKLCGALGSDFERGLTSEQAERNYKEFKGNSVNTNQRSFKDFFGAIFGDSIMLLFVVISLVAVFLTPTPSVVWTLIVSVFACIFFHIFSYIYVKCVNKKTDVYKTNKYKVKRDGVVISIDGDKIVPGDIIIINRGDVMPCDGVILKRKTLRVLESHVTGCNEPVLKRTREEALSIGCPYFECILFSGTVIITGFAEVFVCNTGKNIFDPTNELVKKQNGEDVKILKKARNVSKQLSLLLMVFSFCVFLTGVSMEKEFMPMIYYACSVLVAAVPFCIDVLCEVIVAHKINLLYKKGAVIKNPSSIDKLCDVNCIAMNSNKYFIHTKPIIGKCYVNGEVKEFEENSKEIKSLFVDCILTRTDENVYIPQLTINGQNIDRAIINIAFSVGLRTKQIEDKRLVIKRYNYDNRFEYSCVMYFYNNEYNVVARGKAEKILRLCRFIRIGTKKYDLDAVKRSELLNIYGFLEKDSECILAIAKRTYSSAFDGDLRELCEDMTFEGFVTLQTPIRVAAAKAVNQCGKSDISVLLMSDDAMFVTNSLAKNISLVEEEEEDFSIDIGEYKEMGKGLFFANLSKYKVFSGFSPIEKAVVLRQRKVEGDITAVVTKGIYDTLPQIEADVSFVHKSASSSAERKNSDVILLKDSFEYIPECIKTARIIYHNIMHVLQFIIMMQFTLVSTTFVSLTAEKMLIFEPFVIVFYGVVLGLFSALCIAFDKKKFIRLKRPAGFENNRLNFQNLILIPFICGTTCGICSVLSYHFCNYLSSNIQKSVSCGLITLFLSLIILMFSIRSDRTLIKGTGEFGIREIFLILVTLCSIGVFVYHPLMNEIINSAPISWHFFMTSFVISIFPTFICEIIKAGKKITKKTRDNGRR